METVLKKRGLMALLALCAGLTWACLAGAIFIYNVGSYEFWYPGRVLAYVLLVIAPALTLIPLGKAMGVNRYTAVPVFAMAFLGFVFAFMPPDTAQTWQENLIPLVCLLGSLFVLLYSLSRPVFYLIGFRFFTNRKMRYDAVRPRREATLLASYPVLVLILAALHSLNIIYILALLMVFVTVEMLFINRSLHNN